MKARPKKPAVQVRRRRDDMILPLPAGKSYSFPDAFVWGASTSSHQVEGMDVHSDWWRFERQPGTVRNFLNYPVYGQKYKSDHWRRFADDIELMACNLRLTGYRFSIDWSRIEPEEGRFEQSVIDRYVDMCRRMRSCGIRPFVTLFHWSSPDWIWDHRREESTGWYHPSIVDRFESFCQKIVPALCEHVDLFVTLNEPNIFLYGGFLEGILAPGHKRDDEALQAVLRHLLKCHVVAWNTIKAVRPDAQVGIAHQFCPFEPHSTWNLFEGWVAARVEQAFTWCFPDAIRDGKFVFATRRGKYYHEQIPGLQGTADFLGVNYYERMVIRLPGGFKVSRLEILHDHHGAKEIWPQQINTVAFIDILRRIHKRYGLPIYITENGHAHPDDSKRRRFIECHLQALGYAINELNIDIRGYFYWSLLDNQEWAHGFVPRLGLCEVDYKNGDRRIRDSAWFYSRVIQERRVVT